MTAVCSACLLCSVLSDWRSCWLRCKIQVKTVTISQNFAWLQKRYNMNVTWRDVTWFMRGVKNRFNLARRLVWDYWEKPISEGTPFSCSFLLTLSNSISRCLFVASNPLAFSVNSFIWPQALASSDSRWLARDSKVPRSFDSNSRAVEALVPVVLTLDSSLRRRLSSCERYCNIHDCWHLSCSMVRLQVSIITINVIDTKHTDRQRNSQTGR